MISTIELIKKLEGEEIVKAVFSTVQESGNVDYITHKIYGHTEVLDKLCELKDNNIEIDDFVIVTKNKAIFDSYNEESDTIYIDCINIGF
jgi:hypothetical protein